MSRSYTFIYNPFTHTGLLTTLKLDDAWSVQNGIVAGCDAFIDPVDLWQVVLYAWAQFEPVMNPTFNQMSEAAVQKLIEMIDAEPAEGATIP